MHVTKRKRRDGLVELAPRLSPLEGADRLLVIVTVLLVTGGFFVCGLLPAPVVGAVAASCLVGEVILGLKAVVLLVLRPVAEVHEVPRFMRRR